MSSQCKCNSNAVDLDPSAEDIHPTSMVSSLDSDVPSLCQKLLEKYPIIRDIENRVTTLIAACNMAHYTRECTSYSLSFQTCYQFRRLTFYKVKLTQERHELIATMKKLGRDFSKMKLSTGRDLLPATTENRGEMYSTLKLLKFRTEYSRTLLNTSGEFSKLPETIDI